MTMNNSGLVSIVIPCFNQSHFLTEAIESVQNQTYKNFEIIVVNDGSTDDTSRVASNFANVILLEQSNQGLANSRNNGLKKCRGEFVVFLDADDTLLPCALEIGVQMLNKHLNCVFVSGLCQRVDEKNKELETIQPNLFSDDFYESLLRSNYIWSPSNVIYRRNLFQKIEPFDPTLNPVADYELYLRIARQFPIFHHSEIVTNYRQHQASMSKNYKMMLDYVHKVYDQQEEFIKINPIYKKAAKSGLASYKKLCLEGIYYQCSQSFKKGEYANALKLTLTLLSYPLNIPSLIYKLVRIKLKLSSP